MERGREGGREEERGRRERGRVLSDRNMLLSLCVFGESREVVIPNYVHTGGY